MGACTGSGVLVWLIFGACWLLLSGVYLIYVGCAIDFAFELGGVEFGVAWILNCFDFGILLDL